MKTTQPSGTAYARLLGAVYQSKESRMNTALATLNPQAQNVGVMNPLLLVPQSIADLRTVGDLIAASDLAPKDYRNKPENVMVAIAMGMELGVSPMQAIQGIAVINGRPAVWGDLLLAICRAHPKCEGITEGFEYDDKGVVTAAICRAKRAGEPEQERRFTPADASKAGLWGKAGPWTQYPSRMLQMRARGFCLRDVFADALKGIASAEEQGDYDDQPRATVTQIGPKALPPAPSRKAYPAEEFEKNFPRWRSAVEGGKKTAAEVLAVIESKADLTTEQRAAILAMQPATQAESEQAAA